MNDVTGLDAQNADGDKLARALAAAQSELVALRSELEETNRGVLALYAELDSQADHLRQATELKSRFLAYMSHEFRTPIGAIQSIAQIASTLQADQLRQASDLKSRFLSYMSHEFRTPLGSILSITSLLADELDGPLSPEQHIQAAFEV